MRLDRQVDRRRIIAAMAPSVAKRLIQMVNHTLGKGQTDWLLGRRLSASSVPRKSDKISLRSRKQRAYSSAAVELVRRQKAIENVLLRMLHRVDADAVDGTIDLDWAVIFVDLAGRTDNPGKQDLWAQLLARELSHPGSVPVVALRRLYEFSSADMALFSTFAPWVIKNYVTRLELTFFEDRGINQNNILYFEEIGLLRPNRDMAKVFQSQSSANFRTHLLYADVVLRVASDNAGQTLSLPIYRLTEAGAALAYAIQKEAAMIADSDYVLALIALIKRHGFKVQQAAILEQQGEVVARHSDFCEMFIWPSKPPLHAKQND